MTELQNKSSPRGGAISGLPFGIVFGFLLHKSGVSNYNVLIGVLRLTDLTVIRVILSAILVGSVVVYLLKKLGWARPHVKPANYADNIVGGLIFGIGFGLWGYCPGTGAAALGQGSWDAGWGILGMVAGSYLYAIAFPSLKKKTGAYDKGKLTVPAMFRMNEGLFLFAVSILLIAFLWFVRR